MTERIRYWKYKTIWSDTSNKHSFNEQIVTTAFMLEYIRNLFRHYPDILTRIIVIDDEGNTYRICEVKD